MTTVLPRATPRPAQGRPLTIVLASHTSAGGTFVVGSHHLARELSLLGHRVLHISNPFSLAHLSRVGGSAGRDRLARALRGPRTDRDAVTHYVPLTALPLSAGGRVLSRAALSSALPRLGGTMRRLGFGTPDLLLVDQPLLHPIDRWIRPGRTVYRPTDLMTRPEHLKAMARHLGSVDMVVATSERVAQQSRTMQAGVPVHVLENGVQWSHFQQRSAEPRRGCIYVGALDARFSWALLEEMATGNPAVPFVIHGPRGSRPPAQLPDNVHLAGPIDYQDVPAALARAQVGLLPMVDSQLNDGRSPMKYYEYLSAGLNVVATSTSTLAARSSSGTWLTGPGRAAADVRSACAAPANLAGREEASHHDWTQRARSLLTLSTS